MRLLVPDLSSVAGGTEKLCVSLFPELAKLGLEITWALPEHRMETLTRSTGPVDGLQLLPVEWPRGTWQRVISGLLRRLGAKKAFNRLHLARIRHLQHALRADHLIYPWILGEPVPNDTTPRTVIVLDRNWTLFPQNFAQSPDELDMHLEKWMKRAVNVIAISRAVMNDLVARWPNLANKVHTIPLAASVRVDRRLWELALGQSAGDPCFYYPATVSPHKGHPTLLAAARLLLSRGKQFRLVLSGHGTDTLANHLLPEDASLLESGVVEGLGYTDSATVERNYLRACAVVLPSKFEGFGLPLAEALAHGTRVICSELPAYREQVERLGAQEFVQIVPMGDAMALADAMEACLDRPQTDWSEREGVARSASRWTWANVAVEYRNLLCKAS